MTEYGDAVDVVTPAAEALGVAPSRVRDAIRATAERLRRLLRTADLPLALVGDKVRAIDIAGLVRVMPGLELEIAPKFLGQGWEHWREDFFFLATLSRHGRLLPAERLSSSSGATGDLATLVGRTIVGMYAEHHRRPLRTYRRARTTGFFLDGEVDGEAIVVPSTEGYEQEVILYDRRNPFNATILAAIQSLLPEVRDPLTRKQLVRVGELLAPQRVVGRSRKVTLPSRARRWQNLHDLSVDILDGFSVTYRAATARAPGYVVETWRAWEDLVTLAVTLSRGASVVRKQRKYPLGMRLRGTTARGINVQPDVSITGPGSAIAYLVDAKYKGRADGEHAVVESDLYEALAFARACACKRVVLVFPAIPNASGGGPLVERLTVDEVDVVAVQLDVRGLARFGGMRRFVDSTTAALAAALS